MTAVGAPAGTKYINRSYLYLGQAHDSDMMHVIVMIRTEVVTGHQTVQFTNIFEELVTPPTGDNFNLVLPIVLMLLSVLGVVAVVIFRRKRVA